VRVSTPNPAADRVDQAARLRQLVGAASSPGDLRTASGARLVAVTSGKGGVGKTNVAVNLAICLARRGCRTLLIDVDLGLANADILLDAHPRFTLAHVISGERRFEEIAAQAAGPIHFVSGGSGVDALINLPDLDRQRLLTAVRSARIPDGQDGRPRQPAVTGVPPEIVVLDCAAGIAASVTTFALAADDIVLVTTPEPTAVTDAYAVVKTLHRASYRGTVRLVVNMADSRTEARQVYERLTGVSEKFLNYPVADGGYLLQDTHVELAVRARTPFVVRFPKSPASVCMAAIAARLVKARSDRSGQQGLLRRVAGLFS